MEFVNIIDILKTSSKFGKYHEIGKYEYWRKNELKLNQKFLILAKKYIYWQIFAKIYEKN